MRYDELQQFASDKYPEIRWSIAKPDEGVIEAFGKGCMLVGEKDGKVKDYFIPDSLVNTIVWVDEIAKTLNERQ